MAAWRRPRQARARAQRGADSAAYDSDGQKKPVAHQNPHDNLSAMCVCAPHAPPSRRPKTHTPPVGLCNTSACTRLAPPLHRVRIVNINNNNNNKTASCARGCPRIITKSKHGCARVRECTRTDVSKLTNRRRRWRRLSSGVRVVSSIAFCRSQFICVSAVSLSVRVCVGARVGRSEIKMRSSRTALEEWI